MIPVLHQNIRGLLHRAQEHTHTWLWRQERRKSRCKGAVPANRLRGHGFVKFVSSDQGIHRSTFWVGWGGGSGAVHDDNRDKDDCCDSCMAAAQARRLNIGRASTFLG